MSKIIVTKKVKLSKRQYEILILRAMKFGYPEIQEKLSIRKKSLKRHLLECMFKLNLISQKEMIKFAKHKKWIECKAVDQFVEYKIKPYEEIGTIKISKNLDY